MDVILMACGDVQVGVHFHGSCSPGLEVGSMGGFAHMVQQPSCHMAQLMTQSSLQLVSAVYHLRAQLYPSTVPAKAMSPDTSTAACGLSSSPPKQYICRHHSCMDLPYFVPKAL